jgi:NhaP-type Na+/H+ or K+/H+ antiporter
MLLSLNLSPITALGLLLLTGYFGGALAHRLKLPALIGYLCAGVLLGPSVFGIMAEEQLLRLDFVTNISLGCIAFSIGSELQFSSLKRLGKGIVIIILAESLFAFATVALGIFLLTHDPVLALLFGAVATASAPAGTVAVIQEYNATGTLTKAIYAVVGFDDGLAIIIFGFALAASKVLLATGQFVDRVDMLTAIWEPVREIGLSILLGGLLGCIFTAIVRRIIKKAEYLIIIFWAVLTGVGLADYWHLSHILVCMVVGFFFVNASSKGLVHSARESLQQIIGL